MDYNQFQPVEDMTEVTGVFKHIFDGRKSYGTDNIRMGFYRDQALCAKIEGNKIIFVMPYNGPLTLLKQDLENYRYNRTNSIMVKCDVGDDNITLTATYYSKEYKLFTDL